MNSRVPQTLAVSATGCTGSNSKLETVFSYDVVVPVGSTAAVVLPMFGAKADAVEVAEGGASVFAKGAFVAGVDGVDSAVVDGTNIKVRACGRLSAAPMHLPAAGTRSCLAAAPAPYSRAACLTVARVCR